MKERHIFLPQRISKKYNSSNYNNIVSKATQVLLRTSVIKSAPPNATARVIINVISVFPSVEDIGINMAIHVGGDYAISGIMFGAI